MSVVDHNLFNVDLVLGYWKSPGDSIGCDIVKFEGGFILIGSVPKPVTFLINGADLDLGRILLLNLLALLMLALLNTQVE